MPFIAIAVVLALSLGGVSYAADQSKPGDALYQYKVDVNDQVRHEYHAIRASIGAEATVDNTNDTDMETNDDTQATTSSEVRPGNALRINTDASGSVPDTKYNADGSVKVNIY